MSHSRISVGIFMAVTFIAALTSAVRCTKDKTPVPAEPCDPSKVYFQRDVFPIINSNCAKSGCHDAQSRQEGIDLSTYAGVLSIVSKGKPSSSKLMEVLDAGGEERMPPPPSAPLTSDQRNVLSRWISDGALNSSCIVDTVACVAQSISYLKDIQPLVQVNCVGCHSGGSAGGGVDLSSYAGVKAAGASGKLYQSVSQGGASVPMPPSGRLSSCDVKKIKSWVDAGFAQ